MQDVGLGRDTDICQYMDLDYLKALLAKGEYYVKRKKLFVDKRERTVPLKLQFEFTPAGSKLTTVQIKRMDNRTKTIQKYRDEMSHLLTSCWTERITENALMWDRNAERHKACIKTKIGDFVNAFGDMRYIIWCGKMLYEPLNQTLLTDDMVWYKEPYFSDEKEIRFYFSTEFAKITPDENKDNGISLPVNLNTLIHEIILSPYIKKAAAEELKKTITEEYGIKTSLSKIEIS